MERAEKGEYGEKESRYQKAEMEERWMQLSGEQEMEMTSRWFDAVGRAEKMWMYADTEKGVWDFRRLKARLVNGEWRHGTGECKRGTWHLETGYRLHACMHTRPELN